jgi:hypothetical protein
MNVHIRISIKSQSTRCKEMLFFMYGCGKSSTISYSMKIRVYIQYLQLKHN